MSQVLAEHLQAEVFEPFFIDIEPSRNGELFIRGISRAIGDDRFVRIRQTTPIERIVISSGEVTPADYSHYFVNMARPHGSEHMLVGQATWRAAPQSKSLELHDSRRMLTVHPVGKLGEYQDAEELFTNYDQLAHSFTSPSTQLNHWFNPDIYSADGTRELVEILTTQGEVVDKEEK